MARQETSGEEGEARQKLRTSRQVYDQIRWDPRLDPAAFVIGYETRESGTEEISLPSFDPEGDIPWHRIQYIRRGTTAVWDRRRRVDLLEGKRSAPAPSAQCGLDARPVHRSAVALIPPREAWAPIEAIRQAHDRHVERWMPHINLLYGFLPEAAFAEARGAIAAALRDVAPFEVTLDDVRRFQHRAGATVWLHPRSEPPGALWRPCRPGWKPSSPSAASRARSPPGASPRTCPSRSSAAERTARRSWPNGGASCRSPSRPARSTSSAAVATRRSRSATSSRSASRRPKKEIGASARSKAARRHPRRALLPQAAE